MAKIIIFGALGQDGRFLSHQLVQKGHEVYGLIRPHKSTASIKVIGVKYHEIDIMNKEAVSQFIGLIQPSFIYNLASMSSVRSSFDDPHLSEAVNFHFVKNLLNVINDFQAKNKQVIRLFQASTSEMFDAEQSMPLNEQSKFSPKSPYGMHKILAHKECLKYRDKYDLQVYIGILFNHESYLRPLNFVSRKITHAAYLISIGQKKELLLGNSRVTRDWGYAPDYTNAMSLILESKKPSDYIIATGELHSIKEICETAFKKIGIPDYENYIKLDKNLLRENDVSGQYGDFRKIQQAIGWQPHKKFHDIIHEMVDFESNSENQSIYF
jgi:GDPmannose 4,6-dehydratase